MLLDLHGRPPCSVELGIQHVPATCLLPRNPCATMSLQGPLLLMLLPPPDDEYYYYYYYDYYDYYHYYDYTATTFEAL